MLEDTRLRHVTALLDDARTELANLEDVPTLRERQHLSVAHDAINTAIRSVQYAQGFCEVCGGVGKVLRAQQEGNGFNWLGGECVACPACNQIGVG